MHQVLEPRIGPNFIEHRFNIQPGQPIGPFFECLFQPDQRLVFVAQPGKELKFEVVTGKDAKTTGLVPSETPDKAEFIKVHLPEPVPKGGETRIRIFKTYTDAASYTVTDGQLVFTRPLGIKRNVVVLPKGWELIECASPGIISTDADGRIRVSFVNDRDDQLPVKIVARRLP